MVMMNLKHLSNKTLLEDLKMLVASERIFLTKILHHLREVDERKLYSDLKYASLYEYTVRELGYSEAAASRRIQASRLLKQIPTIESKIESGELSLTNLAKAQRVFNDFEIKDPNKKKKILDKISNKSSRECDKELSLLFPPSPLPKEGQRVLTPDFTQIKVNVSEQTFKQINQAKELLGKYHINDEFMNLLTLKAIIEIKRQKFKFTQNPRKNLESTGRYISNEVKRAVTEVSHGMCENCGSLFMLQFDHIEAYALGGKSEAKNLRLLCFNCNQRARIRAKL